MHSKGEEKGGKGLAGEQGVRGKAEGMEGMGSCPFHMKAAFQMEMVGSAAALGQWPPSLCSPQPQRTVGTVPEEPLSPLPRPGAERGAEASRGSLPLRFASLRFAGCSRACRPGPAGHENCLEE